MAWSVTDRGAWGKNASSDDFVSATFTPAANALLLFFIFRDTASKVTSISGHAGGSPWVQIEEVNDNPKVNYGYELWGCFTGSSPSSGTVTITLPYSWKAGGNLIEISESVNGVDVSGTVANALGTSDFDAGYNHTPMSCTLSSFANSGNLTCSFGLIEGGEDETNFVFEAGYTEINAQETAHVTKTGYYAGEDTTVTATCVNWVYNGLLAFEVKAAGGSIGTVCWGDDNPDEEYIRDFTGNITEGSGYRILGSGDLERVEFEAGGYIEIETWNLGVMRCSITTDKYESGSGSLAIKYKDGVDQSACEADSWNVYTGAFDCTGWIKVRVEAS